MASIYPSGIDSSVELPVAQDNITSINADVINRLRTAIIAIESELGVKPSGTNSTVKARLNTLEGFLFNGDIANIGGNNVVVGLRGRAVSNTVPLLNQVYSWTGSNWTPTTQFSIANVVPTLGQTLIYDGVAWTPQTPVGGGGGNVNGQSLTLRSAGAFNSIAASGNLGANGAVLQIAQSSLSDIKGDSFNYTDNLGFSAGPFFWCFRKNDVVRLDINNVASVAISIDEINLFGDAGKNISADGYGNIYVPLRNAGIAKLDGINVNVNKIFGKSLSKDFQSTMYSDGYIFALGIDPDISITKFSSTTGDLINDITAIPNIDSTYADLIAANGHVWLIGVDSGNSLIRLRKYTFNLSFISESTYSLANPFGLQVTYDSSHNKLFFNDSHNGKIVRVDEVNGSVDSFSLGSNYPTCCIYDVGTNKIWASVATTADSVSTKAIDITGLGGTLALGGNTINYPLGLHGFRMSSEASYGEIAVATSNSSYDLSLPTSNAGNTKVLLLNPTAFTVIKSFTMDNVANWQIPQLQQTLVTSASYTMSTDDQMIMVNRAGAVTIQLPLNGIGPAPYTIKDTSGNASTHNITITDGADRHIDAISTSGGAGYVINTNYGSVTITQISNGTSGSDPYWGIIAKVV